MREIRQLDVFEVTATATPMNNGTRVLSTKIEDDDDPDRVPTEAELEREMLRLGLITSPANAEQYRHADSVGTGLTPNGDSETKALYDRVRDDFRDDMARRLTAADAERKAIEPVKVATFKC